MADCFPTIEYTTHLKDIARHVGDADVLSLVGLAVASGGASAGRLWWQRRCEIAFGYAVPGAKVASMTARLVEMTTPPSDKIDAAAFNLGK